ncbi:MAG: hypothetical protein JWO30_2714 [Fibrobacteres bacterium]|nr:hypothetical protein [Fibrobacterota bacterium]
MISSFLNPTRWLGSKRGDTVVKSFGIMPIGLLFAWALLVQAKAPLDPLVPGIHPLSDTEVLLCLQAPGKTKVNAVGDFNAWTPSAQNLMTQEGDKFWITIGNLVPGREYIFQYWIDDGIKVGDPYAEKIVDFIFDKEIVKDGVYPGLIPYTREFDGPASVFTAGMPAPVPAPAPFVKPAPENLLIYETLVRDFVKTHSFREVRDSLAYFKRLGVNAIELMPVMEFENNDSWGYNPSYMFAVDKYYGPADELKSLVQAAHAQGMAVILDIVLNHAMGQSPLIRMYWDKASNKLMADNPYANVVPRHDYNVGFDLNYGSQYTLSYYKQVLQHWLREYHVDGYRIDLSKGLTQKNTLGDVAAWGHLDTSRVRILGELAAAARTADPDAFLILEHFADNDEEKLLSSQGFLLWGNSSFDHGYAEEGRITTNFAWACAKNRGWAENHLVTYMESHDEERIVARADMNGLNSGGYDVKNLNTGLERAKLTALFLFGIPGPKQLWEWGEWGDDRPKGVTPEERMGRKPLPEGYRQDAARLKVWNTYASLLHFRQQFQAAFKDGAFAWKPDGGVRNWKLTHGSINAYAVGNFGVTADKAVLNLTGTWYDFFSNEKFTLAAAVEIPLQPGEFHLFTDKPVFANQEKLTAFSAPKVLNPQAVAVGVLGSAHSRTGSRGLRLIRGDKFQPQVLDGQGGSKNIQGRNLID